MGILFISHSSRDNTVALRVRDWLRANGWNDIFLDLDPSLGVAPGQRWQEELKRAGENCAAVVVLVSPNWLGSIWCRTEFLLADQLGKRVFPILIAPTPIEELPVELRGKFQIADISTPENEQRGFEALRFGLKRAGLDPESFDWPPSNEPHRDVYRGLQPLDVQDAAIFFGRDAAATRGLDELRRLRDGAPARALVILGASGAGKSSFLRAGLVARLQRDEQNFLVLPIVRPERAAITGPQGLRASLGISSEAFLRDGGDLAAILEQLRKPIVARLRRSAEAAREEYASKAPTIILPIDQAEELFAAGNSESLQFRVALAEAIAKDGNTLVLATVRTDSYEPLQNEWMSDRQSVFTLPSIVAGAFQQIIEGPARLAKPPINIEPALTQQLLTDLDASDALPLLAFAMQRLHSRFATSGRITLLNYRDLGGLAGAIQSAVDAVLGEFPSKDQLAEVRRLFIPALVQIDQRSVKRRVAERAEIPDNVRALVDRFVEQRLLLTDGSTVEVAHEAILRQWGTLAGWIAEERDALQTLESVRAAAREWRERGRADGWLTHQGARLKVAARVAARPDFADTVDRESKEYLAACVRRESSRRRTAGWTLIIGAVLLGVAFAGGLAAFATNTVQRRQAIADDVFRQWRQPEMVRIRAVAQRAEIGASGLQRLRQDLEEASGHLTYANLALETLDRDATASSSRHSGEGGLEDRARLLADRDAWRARIDDLRRQISTAAASVEVAGADDAVVTVALFYARIYELGNANGVDRKRLADELGVDSRFWAGVDREGASFVLLDGPARAGAASWLRERAVLGAAMVQRDHDEEAPDSLLQALGFNQSSWQQLDEERRRRAWQQGDEERRRLRGDPP